MNVKAFVKEVLPVVSLVVLNLIIFASVFWLFELDWALYLIASGLILIFLLFYIVYRAINFKQKKALEQQIQELSETLKEERNISRIMREDIEEYFLLWVHQVKTPITASYLLIEDSTSEQSPLLQQELLKIENYTNMALNYLKVLNPSTDMEFSWVSIDDLIRPLVKKYRVHFIYSKITLHYEKSETKILTDPKLTSLMIEQLLSNALKYTKNVETRDIWVAFNEETKELSIKDNGIGIRTEEQQRIFDKGYAGMNGQLDTKSSGIGLYLVQLISKRLEQPISLKSAIGKGAEFTIQLFDE